MLDRNSRHKLLQTIFWSALGRKLISMYEWFDQRFKYVVMNYSLHSDTNGEFWLITQVPPNAVVFDVGFNAGDFSQELVRHIPNAQVTAFDPAKPAKKAYEKLFSNHRRVKFIPAALSSEGGRQKFYDYQNECSSLVERLDGDADGSAPEMYGVDVLTIDGVLQSEGIDQLNFLKVDTEGFDLHVLEGARQSFAEERIDLVMFEFASGWYSSKRNLLEVVEFLTLFPDYQLYRLFNGFLAPFQWSPTLEARALGSMFVIKHKDLRLPTRSEYNF